MIIIKGRVSTTEGPIPIDEVKPGMLVIDRWHRMREVLSVDARTVTQVVAFARSGTEVSVDAVINSVYGKRGFLKDSTIKEAKNPVRISGEGDRIMTDEFKIREAAKTGYEIVLSDSQTLFIDGYSFDLEGNDHA